MNRELIVTEDGSHSLFVKDLGETFHSKHGAIQESVHVYIKNGLQNIDKEAISVLEFGFGTGLNALLTFEYAQLHHKEINYETIEAYPLQPQEYELLNYSDLLRSNLSLQTLHELPFNEEVEVAKNFRFLKHLSKIEDFNSDKSFDIIYYDVFGYDFQSELWSENILEKAYRLLKPDGILVTYACKSNVNKRLKQIGFNIKKLAGPPGKREMTFAVKKI